MVVVRVQDSNGVTLTDAQGLTGTSWTWNTNPNMYDLALLHCEGNVTDEAGATWSDLNGGSTGFDPAGRFGDNLVLTAPRVLRSNRTYTLSDADFTVECWVKPNRVLTNYSYNVFTSSLATGSVSFGFGTNARIRVAANNGTLSSQTGTGRWSADGLWHHIALVRIGTTLTVYWDGQSVVTLSLTPPFTLAANQVTIGSNISESFQCGIDEFRWSMGARYTAAFTPPAAPFAYTTLPPSASQITLSLESVRNGITSHQKHEWTTNLI